MSPRRRRRRREELVGLLLGLAAACLLYGFAGLLILLSDLTKPPTPGAMPTIAIAR